jgi:hypothetical protein
VISIHSLLFVIAQRELLRQLAGVAGLKARIISESIVCCLFEGVACAAFATSRLNRLAKIVAWLSAADLTAVAIDYGLRNLDAEVKRVVFYAIGSRGQSDSSRRTLTPCADSCVSALVERRPERCAGGAAQEPCGRLCGRSAGPRRR